MKGSKKILSLGLAVAMAFSVGASAFAASAAEKEPAYTPTYNDRVTEEKVGELITMADGLLESAVWANYGSTVIEALLGVFPGLGGEFATAEFYQKIDAEVFADLTGEVTADSLAAYLAEHPIAAASSTDVIANLEKVLPAAVGGLLSMDVEGMGPVAGIINLLSLISGLSDTLNGIDELAKVLGADIGEESLFNILFMEIGNGYMDAADDAAKAAVIEQGAQDLTDYLMAIVRLLAPNTVDKLLTLVNTYSDNQAAVLTAVNNVTVNLQKALTNAATLLGAFGLEDIVPTLNQINDVVIGINDQIAAHTVTTDVQAVDAEGNPVVDGDGNPVYEQVLDLDGLVNQLLVDNGIGAIVAVVADGEESTAMLKLSSVNDMINSIAAEGCDSSADVLMVAYNYLYDNIFGNDQNYTTIKNALPMISSLLPQLGLDEATVQMITEMIPTITGLLDQLKAAGPLGTMDTLMVLLGILEDPNAVTPTDPTQPSGGDGNTTDTENPATGDAALGAVVMMGTAAAAAIVLLRRKK
ncbi:MAG TPA: hypothetical protein IAB39_10135 [Candidatus Onthovicinus excrementipullorum]|nr:hypothetical protein [Candidatus Onthovicinus excrementipullorum]